MKTSRPYWAIPLTVLATLMAIVAGTVPATALLDPGGAAGSLVGGLGVSAAAVLLVFLWRRFLLRRSWAGVGLRWDRSTLPRTLLGVAAAVGAVLVANLLGVASGAAEWLSWSAYRAELGPILPALVVILSVSILLQGFPEELLWRGNLHDLLSQWLSTRMVLLHSSVFFGLLHIVSQSGAVNAGESLLYVVMAVALGFACAAAREGTGSLWPAVGVHSGLHLGMWGIPVEPTNFALWLVLLTVMFTLVGGLFLGRVGSRRRERQQELRGGGR